MAVINRAFRQGLVSKEGVFDVPHCVLAFGRSPRNLLLWGGLIVVVFLPTFGVVRAAGDELATRREVRARFEAEYRGAQQPWQMDNLAWVLFEEAAKSGTAAVERQGLLLEARDLFVQVGNLQALTLTIRNLVELEGVDYWPLLIAAFEEAARELKYVEQHMALVDVVGPLIEEAESDRRFGVAADLVAIAIISARRISDRPLIARLGSLKDDIQVMEKVSQAAAPAIETLAASPEDSAAHLQVGRYLCLYLGEWDEGLAHLAKSQDVTWAPLARQLQQAMTSEQQIAAAEVLAALAVRESGVPEARLQAKAVMLLSAALPSLEGSERTAAEKQIDELTPAAVVTSRERAAIAPEAALELFNLNRQQWTVAGDALTAAVKSEGGYTDWYLSRSPTRTPRFVFGFKMKAPRNHSIRADHAGLKSFYIRGYSRISGSTLDGSGPDAGWRKNSELVHDPDAYHSMMVRANRDGLLFFYDGVFVGKSVYKSGPNRKQGLTIGFGQLNSTVLIKDMFLLPD